MTHQELKTIIDNLGLPARGRIKMIADKTGYSSGMVSKLLSGHAAIAERFITVLNNSFSPPKIVQPDEVFTLRDKFAMSALAGIIAEGSGSYEADAKSAYRYADEMLKARILQPESI